VDAGTVAWFDARLMRAVILVLASMTMVACTQSPVQLPAFYEAGTSDATIYEASAPDGESQGGDAGDAGAKKDGAAEDGGDAKAPTDASADGTSDAPGDAPASDASVEASTDGAPSEASATTD
jgi:hypothetical protein